MLCLSHYSLTSSVGGRNNSPLPSSRHSLRVISIRSQKDLIKFLWKPNCSSLVYVVALNACRNAYVDHQDAASKAQKNLVVLLASGVIPLRKEVRFNP
jgi:hypothetical protein